MAANTITTERRKKSEGGVSRGTITRPDCSPARPARDFPPVCRAGWSSPVFPRHPARLQSPGTAKKKPAKRMENPMFGLKRKQGPTQPFTHADDCKIVKADPTVQVEWSEVSAGHWEAVCACGHEYFNAPLTDDRERLDPYDPSTFRHAGQCEHRDTTDPALLRAILRVRDGVDGGYWWVQCATCDHGWQVSYYPQPPMRLMPPPK